MIDWKKTNRQPDCLPIRIRFYFLVFFSFFPTFQFLVPCGGLCWLSNARQNSISYRVVSFWMRLIKWSKRWVSESTVAAVNTGGRSLRVCICTCDEHWSSSCKYRMSSTAWMWLRRRPHIKRFEGVDEPPITFTPGSQHPEKNLTQVWRIVRVDGTCKDAMHFLTLNFFQLISICTSSYDISALWCRDCISNIRVTQIEHAQVLTCKLTRSSQTCRLRDIADSNTSFATLFKTDVLCNTGKLWLRKQRLLVVQYAES